MVGIGFIVFGAFVSLFGYVLITCVKVGNQHCNNKTLAEIIRIKQLTHLEDAEDFFEITVKYIMNGMQFTSTFVDNSLDVYRQNKHIEVFCNPKDPSHIISKNEHISISPLFVAISIIGTGCLLWGLYLTIFG